MTRECAPFPRAEEADTRLGRALDAFRRLQEEHGPTLVALFWDGESTWSLTFTDLTGQREHLSREDLFELLLLASGAGGQKTCRRCQRAKPLGQFAKSKNSKEDGRLRYCKQCEAARVRDYLARRRARRTSSASAESKSNV